MQRPTAGRACVEFHGVLADLEDHGSTRPFRTGDDALGVFERTT